MASPPQARHNGAVAMKFPALGFDRLYGVALGAAAAATLAGLAGRWHWLLELASNFRVQLALTGLALLIMAAIRRRALAGAVALALCIANFLPLAPYIVPVAPPPAEGARLRLMNVNLQNWSTRSPPVTAMVLAGRADLIVFTEIAAVHREAFADLAVSHPFQAPQQLRDGSAFDVRLFSRWPLENAQVHLPEGPDFPIIEARLCEPVWPHCLRLIALHAPRPSGDGKRDRQLAFAAKLAAAPGEERVLLMGDLNVTGFSPRFADLLEQSGLRDSLWGQGLQTSWLSRFLPLGLTLDHVLVGPGIGVIARGRGQEFGSDHSPVIVDIVVP